MKMEPQSIVKLVHVYHPTPFPQHPLDIEILDSTSSLLDQQTLTIWQLLAESSKGELM